MNSEHIYPLYYRTFAKIDLDAIEHNFRELKALVNPDVKCCCVIKSDAYGHGAAEVAALLSGSADYFAVACIEEAVELRNAGIETPILILGYTSPMQYQTVLENNLTITLYDFEQAKQLSQVAVILGKKAKIHIAVDTGMGRIGFQPTAEDADIVKEISKLEGVYIEGLFSHYAKADYKDKASANEQTRKFDCFISLLEKRGVAVQIKHICNSAAIIEMDKHYDMVRMGISLYGMYPSDEVDKTKVSLILAMEVVSHIIHVKTVSAGTPIGYGQIYTAPEERKIATVAVGYADGYNRCMTENGTVIINGQQAPVVGKVCMDQIMVDVTDIDFVEVGDHAVILGEMDGEKITAEDIGERCNSFDYEVVCNFSKRVKRLYYNENRLLI